MSQSLPEPCTILVTPRDRFSTTAGCLDALIANTPQPFELIVVAGGVPKRLQSAWQQQFGRQARFIFEPRFLNPAQARNIGLRAASHQLTAIVDNNVYVRPGWLSALVQCQRETKAVMVVPVILETKWRIHTAGNDFYVTHDRGRAFIYKHLRYYGMVLGEHNNLARQRAGYGELHCQLVEVEPTLRLGAFDERLREGGEVDSGLTWAKAGCEMWFEPASVVYYDHHGPVEAEDIRFFAWRWDMRTILNDYQYFEQKWGMDLTEHGTFGDWLLRYNSHLGLLPRLFPSAVSLAVDRQLGRLRESAGRLLEAPARMIRQSRARWMGYDEWRIPQPVKRTGEII